MSNITNLSIQVLIFGVIAVVAINLIGSNTYDTTTVTTIQVPAVISTYPYNIQFSYTNPVVNGSEVVFNSTETIFREGGNYSLIESNGTIQIDNAQSRLAVGNRYNIQYRSGQVDSTIVTIAEIVVSLVILIVAILLILKMAGVNIGLR